MKSVPAVLLSLCLVMSCDPDGNDSTQDAGTEQDAGTNQDAGTEQDAGTNQDAGILPDAGTIPDAGTAEDAGTPPPDAGLPPDAGTAEDAGTTPPDAGLPPDAGTTPDAGTIETPCGIPYLGDPNGALDFTITALGPDWRSSPLTTGSTLTIIEPIQGGRVSFVGVRDVVNIDPCGVSLLGALRNPETGRVVLDSRTVNLQRSPDGKGSSTDADDSSFSNVTLCPNQWSNKDIYDQNYELVVILKDRLGKKSLQKTLMVRPACNVPGEDAFCRCICKANYVLGSPCP